MTYTIKITQQTRNRRDISQLDEGHYNPTANIPCHGKELNAFNQRSGGRKDCHHFYLTLCCDTLPLVIREGGQIKGNKLERKEQKTLSTQRSSGPLGETMTNNLNFDRWAISKVDIFLLSLGLV